MREPDEGEKDLTDSVLEVKIRYVLRQNQKGKTAGNHSEKTITLKTKLSRQRV